MNKWAEAIAVFFLGGEGEKMGLGFGHNIYCLLSSCWFNTLRGEIKQIPGPGARSIPLFSAAAALLAGAKVA